MTNDEHNCRNSPLPTARTRNSTAGSSFPALLFLDSSFPYPLYIQLYAPQILLIKFITIAFVRRVHASQPAQLPTTQNQNKKFKITGLSGGSRLLHFAANPQEIQGGGGPPVKYALFSFDLFLVRFLLFSLSFSGSVGSRG